jgi:hypothetical protein
MRSALLLGAALLASACASAPRPGPTQEGIAVSVPARDEPGARRQAVESLLPLFLTPAARRERAAAVDKVLFASAKRTKAFIGYQKVSKKTGALVEVKIDALSAALQNAGLIRPPGYTSGPEVLLLALGDRAVGPTSNDRFAVDALETALFGRGIQAHDADDQMVAMEHPITAKTEAGTVAQAAAGGWTGVATGRAVGTARHEVQSNSWRGRAQYALSLYGLERSTEPFRVEAEGEALNVSSSSAVTDAIEVAAQGAAVRVETLMARKHVGRATIGVLITGYKEPAFLNHLVADLRRTEGVDGASLISWNSEGMALIHVYATTLTADGLAAKLINADTALRITGIETEDGRLTIAGPEIPASEDRGEE